MAKLDVAFRRLPRSSQTPPDRRDFAARRFKTFWPTEIRTSSEQRRAHVLNISSTGAKIHARELMDVAQTVEIMIGGEWRDASVRWRRGQTFGIAFNEPIPGDVVDNCLIAG